MKNIVKRPKAYQYFGPVTCLIKTDQCCSGVIRHVEAIKHGFIKS